MCSTNITTEIIEVIENPLQYIEQPCLCIPDTLHKFYDRGQGKCITLAANISDEEFIINKGITICFMHVTEVCYYVKLTESINEVNWVDLETKESAISKVVLKETLTPIPLNPSLMFHKDFNPKPRITLLDTDLSNKSKHQVNDPLEVFSDIMSKNSKDIGLTYLEEMVLLTKPGAAPVVSKPYDLPHKHHKFVKEELTNLPKADLIERSLCSPNYSGTYKAPQGSSLTQPNDWLLIIMNSINNSQRCAMLKLELTVTGLKASISKQPIRC